jgi:hypothetical protein
MLPKIVHHPYADATYSPDGKVAFSSGGWGNKITAYSLETRAVVYAHEIAPEEREYPKWDNRPKEVRAPTYLVGPTFTQDGGTAFIGVIWQEGGFAEGYVAGYDWNPPRLRYKVDDGRFGGSKGGTMPILCPDNKRFVTLGFGRVRVWDVQTGKKLASLKASSSYVIRAAFSADGRWLAWLTEGGVLTMVEFSLYRERYSFRAAPGTGNDLSFTPDGSFLAVACQGQGVKFFEPETGVEKFTLHSTSGYHRFSASGGLMACLHTKTYRDRGCICDVHLWDWRARRCIGALAGKKPQTTPNFDFSPDGTVLAVSYHGSFAFSPDGRILAVSDRKIEVHEIEALVARGVDASEFKGDTGTSTISTDVRTGRQRAADWAARVKGTPKIKGMPAPSHLTHWLARMPSRCTGRKCVGHVQCPCGSRKIRLSTSGMRMEHGKRFPQTVQIGDKFYFIITVICAECGKDHVLFDANLHGWNAVVGGDATDRETAAAANPPMIGWTCDGCDATEHTASMELISEGRQDAMEESGGVLDETNWQEGFGWINISIACCHCGQKVPNWVSYETM